MSLLKMKNYHRQSTLNVSFKMLNEPQRTPQTWTTVQSAVECLPALFSQLDSLAVPGGNNYPTDFH